MEEQITETKKWGRPKSTGGASGMVAYHKTSTGVMYPTYRQRSENPVTVHIFKEIVHGFFKFIAEKLLDGYQVMLPLKCGELTVVGNKIKPKLVDGVPVNLAPDWGATHKLRAANPQAKEERKMVYFLNEHTNGVRYKCRWLKAELNAENKTFYSFQLTNTNKSLLHKKIMSGKDYMNQN